MEKTIYVVVYRQDQDGYDQRAWSEQFDNYDDADKRADELARKPGLDTDVISIGWA